MKQCPKCGRYMTWYCKSLYGTVITGWRCFCGYDTMYSVRYKWSTDTTDVIEHTEKGKGNDDNANNNLFF